MLQIKKLICHDFRNHKHKELIFTENVVIFWGGNGQGKTNLLEAISIMSAGKSWRESSGQDLITDQKLSAKIEIDFNENIYATLIEAKKRQFFKNEKKTPLKSHLGSIPTLLFCPEHLGLFSGTKTNRLKFFDRFLVQMSPTYRDNLIQASRAHKQKTACLKLQEEHIDIPSLVSPWNNILAATIPHIISERKNFLQNLAPILQSQLSNISGNNDEVNVAFEASQVFTPTQEGVLDFFKKDQTRELAARRNFIAPHSGDIVFSLRGKKITQTASRGEERSVLLALLAAKKNYLKETHNIIPILLLDDVFSELDDERQKHLQSVCKNTQVFFTTTHKEHFQNFDKKIQSIEIK